MNYISPTSLSNSFGGLEKSDSDEEADLMHDTGCRRCAVLKGPGFDDDDDDDLICGDCEPDIEKEDMYEQFSSWAHKTSMQIKGKSKAQARTHFISSISELDHLIRSNSRVSRIGRPRRRRS